MVLTAGLVFFVLILLVVLATVGKKKPMQSQPNQPPVMQSMMQHPVQPQVIYQQSPQVSFREQQLNENAAMYAQEYRSMIDQEQREAIRESLAVAEAFRELQAEKRSKERRALFASQ